MNDQPISSQCRHTRGSFLLLFSFRCSFVVLLLLLLLATSNTNNYPENMTFHHFVHTYPAPGMRVVVVQFFPSLFVHSTNSMDLTTRMCATCLRTCVNNPMDSQWTPMYHPACRSGKVRWRAAEVCRQPKELQAKDKTVLRIGKNRV